jgi:DNA-directed RNA polymerase subunit N (RpoN/RPB10)
MLEVYDTDVLAVFGCKRYCKSRSGVAHVAMAPVASGP